VAVRGTVAVDAERSTPDALKPVTGAEKVAVNSIGDGEVGSL
jgi:hypothetical protein